MTNEILDQIKSRGYWQVIARPQNFSKVRIPSLLECERLVEENQVRLRGWYFPHIYNSHLERGIDYIELNTNFKHIRETWRFYQSGQFVFFSALAEDWITDYDPTFIVEPNTRLGVITTLYELSEIYEFAKRLSQQGLFDDTLVLEIKLSQTQGRSLFFWPEERSRILSRVYSTNISHLERKQVYNTTDFIINSREYSFNHFLWIMERFGFDASPIVFKSDQEKLFSGIYA